MTRTNLPDRRDRFTLIELSIVLVIIGGIVLGRDMVRNSEIRAQVKDVEKLKTAVNAFKLKYACLPGDCASATRFFSASRQPQQVRNGDGNGKIQGSYGSEANFNWTWWPNDSDYADWAEVFDQLSAASLWDIAQYDETNTASKPIRIASPALRFTDITDATAGQALYNKQGGMAVGFDYTFGHIGVGNKVRLGVCGGISGGYPGFGCGIRALTAYGIDVKIDDGTPYGGAAILTGPFLYPYRIPGTAQDDTGTCGTSASNTCKLDATQYDLFAISGGF